MEFTYAGSLVLRIDLSGRFAFTIGVISRILCVTVVPDVLYSSACPLECGTLLIIRKLTFQPTATQWLGYASTVADGNKDKRAIADVQNNSTLPHFLNPRGREVIISDS